VITTEVSASASLGTLEPDVNIRPSLDRLKLFLTKGSNVQTNPFLDDK